MTVTKENKVFLEGLIEYYISEAQSYREMAQEYSLKIDSVPDTTFGIIVGCIYSSFLQTYSNQNTKSSCITIIINGLRLE